MSDFVARIGHDSQGKPCVELFKKGKPFPKGVIPLNKAWLYSEDHNPDFERQIAITAHVAYEQLSGESISLSRKAWARKMAEIASLVEQSIDELLATAPIEPEHGEEIGEGLIDISGNTIPFTYTDKGKVTCH